MGNGLNRKAGSDNRCSRCEANRLEMKGRTETLSSKPPEAGINWHRRTTALGKRDEAKRERRKLSSDFGVPVSSGGCEIGKHERKPQRAEYFETGSEPRETAGSKGEGERPKGKTPRRESAVKRNRKARKRNTVEAAIKPSVQRESVPPLSA